MTRKGLRERSERLSKRYFRKPDRLLRLKLSIPVARARIMNTLCLVVQLFKLHLTSFDMRITVIIRNQATPTVNVSNVQHSGYGYCAIRSLSVLK